MDYNKSYAVLYGGVIIGLAIAFIFGYALELIAIGYFGLAVSVASIIQTTIFYKCPKCGAQLNIRAKKPQYCPNCGKKL